MFLRAAVYVTIEQSNDSMTNLLFPRDFIGGFAKSVTNSALNVDVVEQASFRPLKKGGELSKLTVDIPIIHSHQESLFPIGKCSANVPSPSMRSDNRTDQDCFPRISLLQ